MKKSKSLQAAELFLYFMMYSVIGWLYEVFLEVAVYRWGFSNRGFLYGPYCIIYGVGALLFLLTLGRLKKKRICLGRISVTPVLVFLGIIVVTTVTELIGSSIMEAVTGGWMWDYERFAFNFQGRIALNPSIRFGIGGMVMMYLVQPLLEKITEKWSERAVCTASGILLAVLIMDLVITIIR